MCKVLGVSRASYYKWKKRKNFKSKREIEDEILMDDILRIFNKYNGIYGYRRIRIYICLRLDKKVGRKRVYRLMKKLGLKSCIRVARTRHKPSIPSITAENIMDREFYETEANKKWVTDVTELILENGKKFYLSAIKDLGTGKIVSYEINYSNNNQLVFNTYKKAIKKVKDVNSLILHSDRGYQYTSKHFKSMLDEHGVIQSMSRVGRCIDNSPMESFWGIMKSEIYRGNKHYKFKDLKTARKQIKEYINFYNNERITLEMERLIA